MVNGLGALRSVRLLLEQKCLTLLSPQIPEAGAYQWPVRGLFVIRPGASHQAVGYNCVRSLFSGRRGIECDEPVDVSCRQ